MKKIFLLLLCSISMLFSCNTINKKAVLKKESSHRGVAGINPNPEIKILKKQIASHVVFLKEGKPVCSVLAFQHTDLLPAGFSALRPSYSINLPKCNSKDIAQVRAEMPNMVVLKNKNDRHQVAVLHAVAVGGACLAGVALGAYLTQRDKYKRPDTSVKIAGSLGLVGFATTYSVKPSLGIMTLVSGLCMLPAGFTVATIFAFGE